MAVRGCGRAGPGLAGPCGAGAGGAMAVAVRGRGCGVVSAAPQSKPTMCLRVQNPESSPDPARSRAEPPEQRPEASWLLGASGCPDEVLEEAIQEERDK